MLVVDLLNSLADLKAVADRRAGVELSADEEKQLREIRDTLQQLQWRSERLAAVLLEARLENSRIEQALRRLREDLLRPAPPPH